MRSLCVFVVSMSLAATGLAQHAAQPAPVVILEEGLGSAHYPVSTKNGEAQRYFDQGLRYVYAFNHEQAVASFKKATDLDPNLAMGYWGMALALGPNINMDVEPEAEKLAYQWAQVALQHAPSASQKEGDLISAVVLEGVLKKAPNHTGANHYYIHTVEASRNPEKALKSAERLQTLAPAAGHLMHMPAHIFQRAPGTRPRGKGRTRKSH